MTQINLLPWRQQTRRLQKARLFLAFAVFLGAIILSLIGMHIYYSAQLSKQMHLNDYLQAQITAEQANLDNIIAKQKDKIIVEDKLRKISGMYTANYNVIRLFNELMTLIPANIKITIITRTDNHISFEGIAPSDSEVSRFMQDIARSPIFNQPLLSIINSEGGGATGGQRYFKIDVDQRG